MESTLRLLATKDEQLQDARAKLDAATREVSEARATVRREISDAKTRLEAEREQALQALESVRRDLVREKELLDVQRSELAVRTEEASEALRNYPTPADAQRAVSRLESALRPTQPLAREIFPGNLPLTPPRRRRVVEEDPRRKPMLRRGLSAIVGVASRRRAARAVADIGDRNRLRAALSVWTRRHSPRGVSFNLNV